VRDLYRRLVEGAESPDVMVLLEPTCPLRSIGDVQDCLERIRAGCDSAATFREAVLNPHRAWKIEGSEPAVFIPGAVPWLPRQLLPRAFQLNGAVYAFRPSRLRADSDALLFGRMGAVVMPAERSVDIDTEMDFLVAEAVLENGCG
jgi:CMP-N,N'-diacetyllegionaminic acid synthase